MKTKNSFFILNIFLLLLTQPVLSQAMTTNPELRRVHNHTQHAAYASFTAKTAGFKADNANSSAQHAIYTSNTINSGVELAKPSLLKTSWKRAKRKQSPMQTLLGPAPTLSAWGIIFSLSFVIFGFYRKSRESTSL